MTLLQVVLAVTGAVLLVAAGWVGLGLWAALAVGGLELIAGAWLLGDDGG